LSKSVEEDLAGNFLATPQRVDVQPEIIPAGGVSLESLGVHTAVALFDKHIPPIRWVARTDGTWETDPKFSAWLTADMNRLVPGWMDKVNQAVVEIGEAA
jgi:hypothetical protein